VLMDQSDGMAYHSENASGEGASEMSKSVDFDDLAGDLFSLNIRGLRSIAALWAQPARYFEAAEQTDWQDQYTPSVRLWLSLIALSSLLQVISLSADSPIVLAYADGFQDAGLALPPELTFQAIGEEATVWIFTAFPIVQLLTFLLILPLFNLWGGETTFSLRVRYGFAMMVPSASLMLIIMPGAKLVGMPAEWAIIFGAMVGLIAFLVDALTVHRGARAGSGPTSRLVRSALIAAVVLLLNVIMHTITQVTSIILISMKYGLAPT